jgi:hypothetical protein
MMFVMPAGTGGLGRYNAQLWIVFQEAIVFQDANVT